MASLIGLCIFFLALSALFSGSEIAYVSANKLKIELIKARGTSRSVILANFFKRPAEFLGSMLVGNNIALVTFTSLMTQLLGVEYLNLTQDETLTGLLINTLAVTAVVLIFGEFLPKVFFRLYAEPILYSLVYPLRFVSFILFVPAWVMTTVSGWFLRLMNVDSENTDYVVSRVELEDLVVNASQDEDTEIDAQLFGKALNLKNTRVRDCMVPRTEIESIDMESQISDLVRAFQKTKLSRILVIDEDIDDVKGYVHHQQILKDPTTIESLILPIKFVTEVMRVIDLMNLFIRERTSIACVVDEFGGLSGLITLEDILEEIFGEIEDEHDEEEYVDQKINENEYLFSGRLEIDYLNEKYPEIKFPEGEYHTLSGYLVTMEETIPEQGAAIELKGYRFELTEVSNTKIELVRVFRLPESDDV